MKKILSLLSSSVLIGTSTTSLVACNTSQYTEKELSDLKEKNNIKTNDGILEWIAPQEKPFKQLDNKYYFVIWRGDENFDWRIIKFKNDTDVGSSQKTIDNLKDQYYLILGSYLGVRAVNLYIHQPGFTGFTHLWVKNDCKYVFLFFPLTLVPIVVFWINSKLISFPSIIFSFGFSIKIVIS
ncbi:lipoprotein [Spiroplasma endosymbiont of Seladonia tumulorum]|uniref:lipoprotein n=1 Tax=Spiroplasma endosymbiont of Seladonia tumulorum TaxID=3066321 RepID=UPI0030D3C7FD